MELIRKGNEVWLKRGRMEIHILTYVDGTLHLQPTDPVMARSFGLDVDNQGYPILETSFGPGSITGIPGN